ncbi:MAG: DUF5103 domain-containing protein [Ignavibacteriales bacterium]|nr:DUF5103 domain-containing protein [Ignavibacteriales bacterium]
MCRNILNYLKAKILFLIFIFLFSQQLSSAQNIEIKSLRVYSSEDQREFPIIDLSDPAHKGITIEFDVQSQFIPNINVEFRFCDSQWNPYDNAFLTNPMYNTEHNLLFDHLPSTVRGARFHYSGTFPNNNVIFPFSGKWRFYLVDTQNRDLIYGSGKFYVVKPEVKLNVQLSKEGSEGDLPDLAALSRTFAISAGFTLPDSLFPANVMHVEIIANRKFNYPIIIDRNSYTIDRFYEWNASNKFSFTARNIRPGNEYRQIDTRDIGKYNSPTVNAKFGDIETSNFFTKGRRDFNGGSLLLTYKNENADYMNVVFKLRPPENIKSPIYLVGAFNDWTVSPDYEMFDDNGLMNLPVRLKRGIYDYQYVTGDFINNKIENIEWEILEGNFWETQNDYSIFLFYKSEEKGGYDKIIGYKKIMSGAL